MKANKIGCFGITTAFLYDAKNVCIGETLDAPNPVAYAVLNNPKIKSVSGFLGVYDMSEIKSRQFAKSEEMYKRYLKYY